MVEKIASAEVGGGLRDELRTLEVVPFRVAVDRELQSMALFGGRVFVGGIQSEEGGSTSRTVDVVL